MANESPIRVLIVEAFEIMLHGLKHILSDRLDIHIVGEATNMETALTLCRDCYPDVVLMDTTLPDIDGLDAVQAIYASQPHLKVIALVCPDDAHLIEAVMHSTALGCLTKNVMAEELIHAIHQVAASKPVMLRYAIHEHKHTGWLTESLTRREKQVLRLLTHGLTNRQIAEHLAVSQFTIKNHMSTLLKKLGADSRTEAAILALQHCLVQTDYNR